MGTRNLTMVIKNAKPVVAQYGQWDGYPEGQGSTILEFLKSKDLFNRFIKKIETGVVKFVDEKKQKEIDAFIKKLGSTDGWLNMEQVDKYDKKFPFFSRNHGGKILELIANSDQKRIWIKDASDFAGESLFCEWAYVIDLDKKTFEVYKGFNTAPLDKEERFFYLNGKSDDGYNPVKHIVSFHLDALPENSDTFVESVVDKMKKLGLCDED